MTATLVSGPAKGTLALAANGAFTYTPNAGAFGSDSFTYRATDSSGASGANSTATVTLAIAGSPAVANSAVYASKEDQPLTVTAALGLLPKSSDPNNLPMQATLVSGPAKGNLTLNADGSFTYTPNVGTFGADSFVYQVSDANGPGSTAAVTLNVAATRLSTAGDSYTGAKGTPLVVTAAKGVLANDADPAGLAMTASVITGPTHGTLALNGDGSFTYTPAAGSYGADSFVYKASDSSGASSTATVALTVAPAPISAKVNSYTGTENQALSIAAPLGVLGNDIDSNGLMMTASLTLAPNNGTVAFNADGSFVYTPNTGYVGSDSFSYQAADSAGAVSASTRVVLTITSLPTNAVADAYTVLANQTDKITPAQGVLANDTDPNGKPLTASLMTAAANGSVVVNADGSFSYTPTANYTGNDSFVYKATDTQGAVSNALVTLSVVSSLTPHAPGAVADSYTTAQGVALVASASKGVLANDTDANNLALIASLISGPSKGTVALNADGSFSYTPNTGVYGTDSFTYKNADALAAGNIATVTIGITAPPPFVAANSYSLKQDQNLTINAASGVLANDTDPDHLALTASLASNPGKGSVTLNANGAFIYTPNQGAYGTDSFTYMATNSAGSAATATVTLAIAPTAPNATTNSYALLQGGSLTTTAAQGVLANDTDTNGLTMTASVVSGPSKGSLGLNANGSFTYIPTVAAYGADSFTYRVTDSSGASSTATVALSITPTPPSVVSDTYTTPEAQALVVSAAKGVLANDTDPNHLTLTATLVSGPSKGTLVLNADGSFSYAANALSYGTDSFTYKATDSAGASSSASVTLNVLPTPPFAGASTYNGQEGQTLTVASAMLGVLTNDTDPNNLAVAASLVKAPTHGTLALNADGTFTYVPIAGFYGVDTFTYKVTDTAGASGTALVSLVIAATPPHATNDAYTTQENTVLSASSTALSVLANDTDANRLALTASVVSGPAHGTVAMNLNGTFTYTPKAGTYGTDSFTYAVKDSTGASSTAVATINVAPTPPKAVVDSFATQENTTLTIATQGVLANDTDANGLVMTASLVTGPSKGIVTLNPDGSFSYTPNAGFYGTDSFTYKVTDSAGASSAATTATLVIAPTPPKAVSDSYSATEGLALSVSTAALGLLANDTDPNGLVMTPSLVTGPSKGTVAINLNGTFTYTPKAGTYGTDSFTYAVKDSTGASSTAVATINVAPAAPVAKTNSVTTVINQAAVVSTATLLANDTDPNGKTMTVTDVGNAASGSVSLAGDIVTFVPNSGFSGAASYSYTVTDTLGATANALVTVNVVTPGAAKIINGTIGNDTLSFISATNPLTLNGGAGNDIIYGGIGPDVLNGGAGNDTLQAGMGAQTLSGGTGDDSFVLGKLSLASTAGGPFISITDFERGGITVGDLIVLSGFSDSAVLADMPQAGGSSTTTTYQVTDGTFVGYFNVTSTAGAPGVLQPAEYAFKS